MATLFEGMWRGDIQSLPVLRSEHLGVMAVLANPQETEGQMVVFPERASRKWKDLTYRELGHLTVALKALTTHAETTLGAELVAQHVEGRGVPDHAHIVAIPSYERGDTDRIHHPGARLPFDEFADRYASLQQGLRLPQEILSAELAAYRAETLHAFSQGSA